MPLKVSLPWAYSRYADGIYHLQTAGYDTQAVREAWESLAVPRLGSWGTDPSPGNYWLPRPAGVPYPDRPQLNTVYWPTNPAAFAFCWVVMPESELLQLAPPGSWPQSVGLHWYDDGAGVLDQLERCFMRPLRDRAVWMPPNVPGTPREDRLVVVPLVDDRWARNQHAREYTYSSRGAGLWAFGQAWYEFGQPAVTGDWWPNNQPPVLDDQAVGTAGGPVGEWIEAMLALAGLKGCVLPEAWRGAGFEGVESWVFKTVQDPTWSAAWFDSQVPFWVSRQVAGGGPKTWLTAEMPGAWDTYLPVRDHPEQVKTYPLEKLPGFDLGLLAPSFQGLYHPGPRPFFFWPAGLVKVAASSEYLATATALQYVLARLAAWLTRPVQILCAGMVPPAPTAHVGMWEWRATQGTTLIHGLTPAAASWGASFARTNPAIDVLRVQDYGKNPYLMVGGPGYPARVQVYDTTGAGGSDPWVDASPDIVRVIPLAHVPLPPNALVSAEFLQYPTYSHPNDAGEYVQVGTQHLYLTGSGYVPPAGHAELEGGLPTHVLGLVPPVGNWQGGAEGQGGYSGIGVAVSTGLFPGVLAGTPGLPGNVNGPHSAGDYFSRWFQWARGGVTGFTRLTTGGLAVGQADEFYGPPGSTYSGDPSEGFEAWYARAVLGLVLSGSGTITEEATSGGGWLSGGGVPVIGIGGTSAGGGGGGLQIGGGTNYNPIGVRATTADVDWIGQIGRHFDLMGYRRFSVGGSTYNGQFQGGQFTLDGDFDLNGVNGKVKASGPLTIVGDKVSIKTIDWDLCSWVGTPPGGGGGMPPAPPPRGGFMVSTGAQYEESQGIRGTGDGTGPVELGLGGGVWLSQQLVYL